MFGHNRRGNGRQLQPMEEILRRFLVQFRPFPEIVRGDHLKSRVRAAGRPDSARPGDVAKIADDDWAKHQQHECGQHQRGQKDRRKGREIQRPFDEQRDGEHQDRQRE